MARSKLNSIKDLTKKITGVDTPKTVRTIAKAIDFLKEHWTGGGGGGAVDSVNGKTGVVTLDSGDIPIEEGQGGSVLDAIMLFKDVIQVLEWDGTSTTLSDDDIQAIAGSGKVVKNINTNEYYVCRAEEEDRYHLYSVVPVSTNDFLAFHTAEISKDTKTLSSAVDAYYRIPNPVGAENGQILSAVDDAYVWIDIPTGAEVIDVDFSEESGTLPSSVISKLGAGTQLQDDDTLYKCIAIDDTTATYENTRFRTAQINHTRIDITLETGAWEKTEKAYLQLTQIGSPNQVLSMNSDGDDVIWRDENTVIVEITTTGKIGEAIMGGTWSFPTLNITAEQISAIKTLIDGGKNVLIKTEIFAVGHYTLMGNVVKTREDDIGITAGVLHCVFDLPFVGDVKTNRLIRFVIDFNDTGERIRHAVMYFDGSSFKYKAEDFS